MKTKSGNLKLEILEKGLGEENLEASQEVLLLFFSFLSSENNGRSRTTATSAARYMNSKTVLFQSLKQCSRNSNTGDLVEMEAKGLFLKCDLIVGEVTSKSFHAVLYKSESRRSN